MDAPFGLKTDDNKALGSVRSTSVHLDEDGSADSMQQVDLVAPTGKTLIQKWNIYLSLHPR